jgi:hypothetical protein
MWLWDKTANSGRVAKENKISLMGIVASAVPDVIDLLS